MATINTADLASEDIRGTGMFDVLMRSVVLHLDAEHQKGRLKGADYSQVYVSSITAVLQQSMSFLLQQQQADKQADLIAQQILNAQAEENNLVAQLAQIEAQTTLINTQNANAIIEGANLSKIGNKIDSEIALTDAQVTKVTKDNLLTDEQIKSEIQNTAILTQEALKRAEEVTLVQAQEAKINQDIVQSQQVVTNLVQERLKLIAETSLTTRNEANALLTADVIVQQEAKLTSEVELLSQKKLTEEAQILDRVTGAVADVVGVIGKQKDLYAAQKDGFERDAEQKAGKLFLDAYSVRKSTDPSGTLTPTSLSDINTDLVLNKLRTGISAV